MSKQKTQTPTWEDLLTISKKVEKEIKEVKEMIKEAKYLLNNTEKK